MQFMRYCFPTLLAPNTGKLENFNGKCASLITIELNRKKDDSKLEIDLNALLLMFALVQMDGIVWINILHKLAS